VHNYRNNFNEENTCGFLVVVIEVGSVTGMIKRTSTTNVGSEVSK
jgi:hypothetical protein